MLFLQLVLFVVLLPGGDSEDALQESTFFQIILTSSFYNRSWTQNQGSAWLDELQTHGWDSKTGAFTYLQPWSKGNFNPFQVQIAGGCDFHFGEVSVRFAQIAYQGSDLINFQNTSWLASPKGGSRAQQVCTLFNQYHVFNEILYKILSDTCPQFLLGLLDAGKAYLQQQVRPEAWLSAGPSPGPGRLLLVCHVSGFYPKPVGVMWMQGEQEQRGIQRGDVLPHADGTWYLRVTLDVAAREAAGLSCRVRHSSLGGQDMVLYWEQTHSTGLVFLAVIVPLVLLAGLALWLWKCWKTHWRCPCTDLRSERDPSSPASSTYLNPAQW
ncbi:T-cell surface glycoprotein CD1a-like isoform X7 [Ursus maritimus]|uniref:T-cell surface glycoprotein CD1a-like n=1 Tax=Ursus maritimus TaxID=29073 RepID=A0A384CVW3_URSMA|nr:T-cell surface glycoprotein CD1a-like isoform X7 [Ursus maritimus]